MSARHVRRLLAAALLSGVLLPLRAYGQCAVQGGTSVAISPSMISFSTPTIVDFDNGAIVYQVSVQVDVRGRGGKPWNLCVSAQTPDLGTVSGVTKPIGDLQWQAPGGSWMPLSITPQLATTGRGDTSIFLNVRVLLSWDADVPGDFGTTVRFLVAE